MIKLFTLLYASLLFISCTGVKDTVTVSYIQDDRTGLCYAVLGNSITCVPCSYEVSWESYFNYRGKYIHKHYFQKTGILAGPTRQDFHHHYWDYIFEKGVSYED